MGIWLKRIWLSTIAWIDHIVIFFIETIINNFPVIAIFIHSQRMHSLRLSKLFILLFCIIHINNELFQRHGHLFIAFNNWHLVETIGLSTILRTCICLYLWQKLSTSSNCLLICIILINDLVILVTISDIFCLISILSNSFIIPDVINFGEIMMRGYWIIKGS